MIGSIEARRERWRSRDPGTVCGDCIRSQISANSTTNRARIARVSVCVALAGEMRLLSCNLRRFGQARRVRAVDLSRVGELASQKEEYTLNRLFWLRLKQNQPTAASLR